MGRPPASRRLTSHRPRRDGTRGISLPRRNDERPEGRRERRPLRAVSGWVWAGRLPAHAEQVKRAPVGQRHQLDPPPALRAFAGEAQRMPAQRILAAER